MKGSENAIKKLLTNANIEIDGRRPWDIQVHDERCYDKFLNDRLHGLGETYIDGWWDAAQIDETIARIIRAGFAHEDECDSKEMLTFLQKRVSDTATIKRRVTKEPDSYNQPPFESMLDPQLMMSCGYWKNLGSPEKAWKLPRNLTSAQRANMELICRKLNMKKGQKLLDIYCGWGNFIKYAASHFDVKPIGLTLSKAQIRTAKKRISDLPIKLLQQDYSQYEKQIVDRIVAIEYLDQIPQKKYSQFMQKIATMLKDDGLFLMQVIGSNVSTPSPSQPPAIAQIAASSENVFVIEDVHNFGIYYYPTFMAWFRNFNKNWKSLAATNFEKYNERFYRMWKFYLLSSAGIFKAGALHVWQIVMSKRNSLTIYHGVR